MTFLTITDVINNAKKLGLASRHIGIPWFQVFQIENFFKEKGFIGSELQHKINEDIIRLQNEYYKQEYKIVNSKIKEIKEKLKVKELELKNKNNKLKKKNNKLKNKNNELKNKNNELKNDEDIDKILEEIKNDNILKNKNIKIEKMRSIKNKIDNIGKGDMDVIEENKDTNKNKKKEFLFHLREEIITIEYEKDYEKNNNFSNALISLIVKNKNKINKITIITKCNKIFFDEIYKCFRIFVNKNDNMQYKKIINATLLISNMIAKFRENLENGKIFFRRTAVMF